MTDLRYPLSWPLGWPRTPRHQITWAPFRVAKRRVSMEDATTGLLHELRLLKASAPKGSWDFVISTNIELRKDGLPFSNRRQPEDQGAAVYFALKGKQQVLACDKWDRIEDNIRAMAKHVEALRGQERWGVGSIERAFTGYLALEEKTGPDFWDVLEIPKNSTEEEIKTARRRLLNIYHPDKPETGDGEQFAIVEEAYRDAMRQIGALT